MKIQCAWCKLDMGSKPPYNDMAVSHTICSSCSVKMLRNAKADCLAVAMINQQTGEDYVQSMG